MAALSSGSFGPRPHRPLARTRLSGGLWRCGADRNAGPAGVERASAVILTMDDPVGAQRLVKRLRAHYPDLPIIARGATAPRRLALPRRRHPRDPEALEASLQLGDRCWSNSACRWASSSPRSTKSATPSATRSCAKAGWKKKPRLKSSTLRDRRVSPSAPHPVMLNLFQHPSTACPMARCKDRRRGLAGQTRLAPAASHGSQIRPAHDHRPNQTALHAKRRYTGPEHPHWR